VFWGDSWMTSIISCLRFLD